MHQTGCDVLRGIHQFRCDILRGNGGIHQCRCDILGGIHVSPDLNWLTAPFSRVTFFVFFDEFSKLIFCTAVSQRSGRVRSSALDNNYVSLQIKYFHFFRWKKNSWKNLKKNRWKKKLTPLYKNEPNFSEKKSQTKFEIFFWDFVSEKFGSFLYKGVSFFFHRFFLRFFSRNFFFHRKKWKYFIWSETYPKQSF